MWVTIVIVADKVVHWRLKIFQWMKGIINQKKTWQVGICWNLQGFLELCHKNPGAGPTFFVLLLEHNWVEEMPGIKIWNNKILILQSFYRNHWICRPTNIIYIKAGCCNSFLLLLFFYLSKSDTSRDTNIVQK